jgi:hypothetical protein
MGGQRLDGLDVCGREVGSASGSTSEMLDPRFNAIVAVVSQSRDVTVARGRQHDAYRRDIRWCQTAPAQYDMNERATSTTVAVIEGVDCLKLCMYQGGLHARRAAFLRLLMMR